MAFTEPKHVLEQVGVSTGTVVADFGAGAGHWSLAAARMVGEEGKVYVIDIQQELLTKVTHLAGDHERKVLRFVHGDCEVLGGTKLPDHAVDLVVLSNILFQCEDKGTVLREAARVLKPKGRLLVVDWSSSFGGMGPQPEHVLAREEAQTLATGAGFELERTVDAGDHHYGLVFRYHG